MQGISTPGDLIVGCLYYAYPHSGMRERRTASSSVAAEDKANQPKNSTCKVQLPIKIIIALDAVEHDIFVAVSVRGCRRCMRPLLP